MRQSVLQDGGRVVLLTGEAGAGKTRLAEEFGEQVRQEGDLFLRGRAVELQGTDPYRPLVEVLQDLLGGAPDASVSRRQEWLDGQLRSLGLDPGVFASSLGELLLLDSSARSRGAENPQIRRHVLFEGVARLLQAAGERQPVCVLLDDLQWAHGAVFEVLDFLVEGLAESRVLLLLAYRSEEVTRGREGRAHPLRLRERRWIEERGAERIQLERLTEEAVGQAVADLGLDRGLTPELHARTEGLALFVAEYLKELAQGGRMADGKLPARAQQIIGYRLEGLGPEDRSLLRGAALLGECFDGGLLAGVVGAPEAHVLHRLEQLREAHQLLAAAGEGGYRFIHALIREALVEEAPDHLKRVWYRAAGEALERDGRTEGRALFDLAFFFREGGDLERAARYGVRSARLYLDQQGDEEAFHRADAAVELLERSGTQDRELQAEVYGKAAEVMQATRSWGKTVETRSRAVACGERALEACDAPLRRADLFCWLADFHADLHPAERARCLGEAEREIGDQRHTVQMARLYACRASYDDIWGRQPLLEKACELFEQVAPGDPKLFWVYQFTALGLAYLGERKRLEGCLERFQAWVRERGDVVLIMEQQDIEAHVCRNLGEFQREARAREELLNLARRIRYLPSRIKQHGLLVETWCALGDFERAIRHAEELVALCRRPPFRAAVAASHFACLEGLTDVAERFVELAGQATLFPVPHPDYEALGEYHAGLGLVEQFFCRTGRPEQFRAFCRAIQKRERDRGVRVEGSWWAEPAEPKWEGWQRLEAGNWAEGWLWEDPHGVCRYAVEAEGLVICATEILGFNELTFPRLVRELDGDFAVEVEMGSAEEMEAGLRQRLAELRAGRLDRSLPFPAAGGLVARNAAGDAVRLGVHMQGSGDVLFDGRVRKARPIYGRTWIEGGRIRLRLERTGDLFRAYCRSAARDWLCLGEVEAPLGRRIWVGPCAEIPTQYLHMVRRADACFSEFRLYCPAADLDSAYEQELLMLRELAEVVVDGEGSLEEFEHGLLEALVRSVEAEWGQRVEADNRGRWKVRLRWGARDGEGLEGLAEASSTGGVQTVDASGKVVFLPLGAERGGGWLLGRERPFESAEMELLLPAGRIARALVEKRRLEEELRSRQVRPVPESGLAGDFPRIVGRSPAMERVLRTVERVAQSAAPALIQGESGTGKEVIARAIHEQGPRAGKAFVAQNCAALPESLLESELFGHKKGAFTGAAADKPGLFEVADGGTIFLDEVADASPGVQAKLLRAVEEGEIRRVGDTRSRQVDVRILSATSRDLGQEVERGKLREDLYFRLNVVRVVLPALRERVEDIPLLAEHFLRRICARDGRKCPGFTQGALDLLLAYGWPGNVRELLNEVERAVARAAPGAAIEVEHLSTGIRGIGKGVKEAAHGTLPQRVAHLERATIREALEQCEGNLSQAARVLGISRPGLRRKMERYGLGK